MYHWVFSSSSFGANKIFLSLCGSFEYLPAHQVGLEALRCPSTMGLSPSACYCTPAHRDTWPCLGARGSSVLCLPPCPSLASPGSPWLLPFPAIPHAPAGTPTIPHAPAKTGPPLLSPLLLSSLDVFLYNLWGLCEIPMPFPFSAVCGL